jgi:aminoglycoside phosphotransferase
VVRAAPLDPAYPALADLATTHRAATVLRALFSRSSHAPVVRAVRFRPGDRHVLTYRDETSGDEAFVKLYRDGRSAAIFATSAAVRAALGAREAFGTAGAELLLADVDACASRRAPGVSLSSLVHAAERDLGRNTARQGLAATGRLLRTLHCAAPAALPLGASLAEDIAAVRRTSRVITALAPKSDARARAVLDAVAADDHTSEPSLVHGDMKADHLFFDAGRVVVLDLDRVRVADRASDLGRLLADLVWHEACGASLGADAAIEAVFEGYEAEASIRARARAWAAVSLVRIAARRVPLAQPGWANAVATLLERARQLAVSPVAP